MSEKCDCTMGSDEMEEIRTFVKQGWWNKAYLGRGTADRMEALQDSYAKKLDEAGLKVIFVQTGNATTLSSLFSDSEEGYYKIVKKEVVE